MQCAVVNQKSHIAPGKFNLIEIILRYNSLYREWKINMANKKNFRCIASKYLKLQHKSFLE